MKNFLFRSRRPPKICFISLYSYSLFNSSIESPFGGSEVRLSIIAKEMAKRKVFDVAYVVFDHDQPAIERRDGVVLYSWQGKKCPLQVNINNQTLPPAISEDAELNTKQSSRVGSHLLISRLRQAFDWRLQRAKESLRRKQKKSESSNQSDSLGTIESYQVLRENVAIYDNIDADIYVLPGNNTLTAELAMYCKEKKKKYVFFAGSDGDYHPGYKSDPAAIGIYGLPGYLMQYSIENAAHHIVQNDRQADLLYTQYGRKADIVPNPIDLIHAYPKLLRKNTILWVGKSDWIKRPEIILEIAQRLPQFSFTVIMTLSNHEIFHKCKAEAEKLSNVTMVNFVPYQQVEAYFAETALFVSTSLFEGFPNTFLQSTKYGVPIVSLQVNPREMLTKHDCGSFCDGDLDRFQSEIERLLTNNLDYEEASRNCLSYVHNNHNKERVVAQLEEVFSNLLTVK